MHQHLSPGKRNDLHILECSTLLHAPVGGCRPPEIGRSGWIVGGGRPSELGFFGCRSSMWRKTWGSEERREMVEVKRRLSPQNGVEPIGLQQKMATMGVEKS